MSVAFVDNSAGNNASDWYDGWGYDFDDDYTSFTGIEEGDYGDDEYTISNGSWLVMTRTATNTIEVFVYDSSGNKTSNGFTLSTSGFPSGACGISIVMYGYDDPYVLPYAQVKIV